MSAIFPSGKNNSGDLRFTDDDGITLLDFWVEKVGGTSPNRVAWCWVEVSANLNTNQDIYCYFGNPNATNISNGDNTFLLFDDFDTYNTSKWSRAKTGGSYSVTNSILKVQAGTGSWEEHRSYFTQAPPLAMRFYARRNEPVGVDRRSYIGVDDGGFGIGGLDAAYFKWFDNIPECENWRNGNREVAGSSSIINFSYCEIKIFSNYVKYFLNEGLDRHHTDQIPIDPMVVLFRCGYYTAETYVEIDWIALRRYTDPEPAFSSDGEIQQLISRLLALLGVGQ